MISDMTHFASIEKKWAHHPISSPSFDRNCREEQVKHMIVM